jgi:hypothetical protein
MDKREILSLTTDPGVSLVITRPNIIAGLPERIDQTVLSCRWHQDGPSLSSKDHW